VSDQKCGGCHEGKYLSQQQPGVFNTLTMTNIYVSFLDKDPVQGRNPRTVWSGHFLRTCIYFDQSVPSASSRCVDEFVAYWLVPDLMIDVGVSVMGLVTLRIDGWFPLARTTPEAAPILRSRGKQNEVSNTAGRMLSASGI